MTDFLDRENERDRVKKMEPLSYRTPEADTGEGFPRRAKLYESTPAELKIREAVDAVEAAGADPLLTDAVNLLHAAREKVADFVDGVERKPNPKDERIAFLESEVDRLKCGLDDIERIVFVQRLNQEVL